VTVGAAALDPGVHRHSLRACALLDRLQHRHRLGGLVGDRAFKRQLLGYRRQVGGYQRRPLCSGEAQGGIDGTARDLGSGEWEKNLVDRVGALGAPTAAARACYQIATDEAEQ